MELTSLSPLAFGLGLAGLAGGLFLLQRLRVRHREVEVVTTLFWHEALHETRARVLVQRFRHPWAYLLVLAIAALLWTAFAQPRHTATTERELVCVLDTSAEMGVGERFATTKAELVAFAAELPASRRRVIASGATRRTLLLPGEELPLLEARLEGLEPEAAPSSLERELEVLGRSATPGARVFVFGATAPPAEALALLPEAGAWRFVGVEPDADARPAFTALGAAPAASGAWDAVDVYVELDGVTGDGLGGLAAQLDGAALDVKPERLPGEAGRLGLLFRDLPAAGGSLELALTGGDRRARLVLPDRPRIRVAASPKWRAALAPVLEADPAVLLVDTDPDLVVGPDGPEDVPRLSFVPAEEQQESFLVTYDDERPAEQVLEESLGSLGLAEIDGAALAEGAEVPITLGVRPGARRAVSVWGELVGEDFHFRDSRSFPLFVARALRWLAGVEPVQPFVAAGETLALEGVVSAGDGVRYDGLGAGFTPPRVGSYVVEDGRTLAASLFAPALAGEAAPLASPDELDAPGRETDPVTWLLLLAGALLVLEWILVRQERMP